MKIVCLTNLYAEHTRAGGQTMMHELMKALNDKHDVQVVCTSTEEEDSIFDGVKIHYGNRDEAARFKPDIIITHFESTLPAIDITRKLKIPMVTVIHNNMPRTRALVHNNKPNNLLVFNTDWLQKDVVHTCRSIVVHPYIDRSLYYTDQVGEYVTLVNLHPRKGSELFYKLAKRLPEYKFLGVKGGYWRDSQDIQELPNVTIIENTNNMRDDVYAKSRIVLMPSVYESFGMVAAEALVSGIPVIAHPTPGLVENLGSDNGFLVDMEDIDQYEELIRLLMTQDKAYDNLREEFRSSNRYDSRKELDDFVKAIEETI